MTQDPKICLKSFHTIIISSQISKKLEETTKKEAGSFIITNLSSFQALQAMQEVPHTAQRGAKMASTNNNNNMRQGENWPRTTTTPFSSTIR